MTTPSDKNPLYVLIYSLAGTVLSLAATWFFVDLRSRWLLRQDSRMSNRSRNSAVLYSFWAWPHHGCCERTPKSRKGSSDPLKELLPSP